MDRAFGASHSPACQSQLVCLVSTPLSVALWAAGGRQLFAATSKGSVRAYRLPLGQDFQELHCSNLPLKQLALSPDACFLFAANTEGLVFVFAVKDRDPSRLEGSEKREDQLPWSDDVLLSRSGLEEKQQQISGLESQVLHLMPSFRRQAYWLPRAACVAILTAICFAPFRGQDMNVARDGSPFLTPRCPVLCRLTRSFAGVAMWKAALYVCPYGLWTWPPV